MGNNGLIDPKPGFSPAASADQSNALLQRPLPTKFSITEYSICTKV